MGVAGFFFLKSEIIIVEKKAGNKDPLSSKASRVSLSDDTVNDGLTPRRKGGA